MTHVRSCTLRACIAAASSKIPAIISAISILFVLLYPTFTSAQTSLTKSAVEKDATAVRPVSIQALRDQTPIERKSEERKSLPPAKVEAKSASVVVLTYTFDVPEAVRAQKGSGEFVTEIKALTPEHALANYIYPVPSYSFPVQGRIVSARMIGRAGEGAVKASLQASDKIGTDETKGLATAAGAKEQTVRSFVAATGSYPPQEISWTFGGVMRGTEISMISLSPYSYTPATGTLRYATELKVEITLAAAPDGVLGAGSPSSRFKIGVGESELMRRTPMARRAFSKSEAVLGKNSASSLPSNPADKSVAGAVGTGSLPGSIGQSPTGAVMNLSSAFTPVGSPILPQLPVQPKYRIIVAADGIYRAGYFEFQDALFGQDFFNADPRTFRMFNKGKEVPVLVSGEADGKFNREDYIEFFGERHRPAADPERPDVWSDPYTDENVYYFYWEQTATSTNRGLRLIESSAEIKGTVPANFQLRGNSFRATEHFESDGIGVRLSNVYDDYRGSAEYLKTRNHSDARDLLFWQDVPFGKQLPFDARLPFPDQGSRGRGDSLRVKIALSGLSIVDSITPLDVELQNTAIISLGPKGIGGKTVATASWGSTKQEKYIVNAALNPSVFNTGDLNADADNQLQIYNFDQYTSPKAQARAFLLNWFEVTYRRLYKAYQDEINFTIPPESRTNPTGPSGRYEFEIGGFTTPDIEIYKKGVGRLTNFIIEEYLEPQPDLSKKKFYRARFQDYVVDLETSFYYALPTLNKKLPRRFEKIAPANLFNPPLRLTDKANAYNFIIITSSRFADETDVQKPTSEVSRYRQWRQQRLKELGEPDSVLVTTVESIYDAFSNGIKTPHAIRDFLDFAYHEWQTPPTYILLLGDANRTYKTTADFVPTFQIQTLAFGAASSDGWFVMVDGLDARGQADILPDMEISRVPAKSRAEIGTYLNKLIGYEQNRNQPAVWKNTVSMIAGDQSNDDGTRSAVFVQQEDDLIKTSLARNYFIKRFNTSLGRNAEPNNPPDPYRKTGADVQAQLNQEGTLILNFMGHGGGGIWSDSQVLTLEAANQLSNLDRLPFVTSMTCFTGAIDNENGTPVLTESLINNPNGGAIGVIASTSVGWLRNDDFMAQSVFDFMLTEQYQDLAIGDMMFRAKIRYFLAYSEAWEQAASMMHQYNIFGDPALRLSIPKRQTAEQKPRITWDLRSHIAAPGDTLYVRGKIEPDAGKPSVNGGIMFGRLTDQNNFDVIDTLASESVTFPIRVSRDTFNVAIPIPAKYRRLVNGQTFTGGQLKVYGVFSGEDAGGFVKFSTAAPFFRSVVPSEPVMAAVGKPLGFSMRVDTKTPLANIYVNATVQQYQPATNTYTQVFNQDLPAVSVGNGVYQTSDVVPASVMQRGNKVIYQASARTTLNLNSISEQFTETIGKLTDAAAAAEAKTGLAQYYDNRTIDFYIDNRNGGDAPVLGARIYNWSDTTARNVKVSFYQNSVRNASAGATAPTFRTDSTITLLGTATVQSVAPDSSVLATIPIPASFLVSQSFQIAVAVAADTTGGNYDVNPQNDLSNQRRITYNLIRVRKNETKSYALDEDATLSYDVGTFSKDGYLRVSLEPEAVIVQQPQNFYVKLAASQTRGGYRIEPADTGLMISETKPAKLTLRYDTTGLNSAQSVTAAGYRFSDEIQRWLKVPVQQRIASTSLLDVNKFGTYTPMRTDDKTGPTVTLGIQGQVYTKNGFAPKRPRITATVQDLNGVYLDYTFVKVIRNDVEIDAASKLAKVSVPLTTTNANTVGITYSDEFAAGTHRVKFIFYDANLGVVESEEMIFQVQDEFEVEVFGNYPNPFKDFTYIAYEIRSNPSVDNLEIKFYTVAGRLINTYNRKTNKVSGFETTNDDFPEETGPHVVAWNGTDEFGNPVANGLYYAKVRATLQGKVSEKILKIVRLR
ncbi:MAG: hypothetical protein IAF08_02590 [Rhizobacter sp.]|nr:hypothetical protein [Chlorobiales bacterium]